MRYMMMTKNDPNHPVDPPTPEMYAAMGILIEEMTKAGVLLATGGLGPNPTHVISSGGKVTVTDGPFIELKELLGGFAVLRANTVEEVIEWCTRFRNIIGDGVSEIVPIFGAE